LSGYAIDSNVLSEVLLGGPRARQAAHTLSQALPQGIVACAWVVAEIHVVAPADADSRGVLADMGVAVDLEVDDNQLATAAARWRRYLDRRRAQPNTSSCPQCGAQQPLSICTRCGSPLRGPRRVLPDFLIGAHALHRGHALITWDRGVYGTYFRELELLSPV